jgi:ketose-bisphosphate aldolase
VTTTTHTRLTELLTEARAARRGIGAFNVVLLEHAEAIVAGAEAAGRPVVLQISENCIRYHRTATPIVAASLALARAASVDVLVHLDHIEDEALVEAGIALGVDSIMYDASRLAYDANVAATRAVAAACHAAGIAVEAELGEIGGKDGVHAPGVRTDPGDAAGFVAATGVDALAVAVGTSHAMTTRDARLDLALIGQIAAACPVPLVLHGSSGVADAHLREAVIAGMTKINIATHLNGVFTASVRRSLDDQPALVDPRKYIGPARDAVAAEVVRLLELLA